MKLASPIERLEYQIKQNKKYIRDKNQLISKISKKEMTRITSVNSVILANNSFRFSFPFDDQHTAIIPTGSKARAVSLELTATANAKPISHGLRFSLVRVHKKNTTPNRSTDSDIALLVCKRRSG